jgi:hypothetical protein
MNRLRSWLGEDVPCPRYFPIAIAVWALTSFLVRVAEWLT